MILSLIGLTLLSPLLIIIALAIKLSDGGPVIFKASRVGKDGELFQLYKFRSMSPDAESRGPGITVCGDPRITSIGKVLRRTKLDELPQLVNVLKGDMALVGPRPEDPRYVAIYSQDQRRVLAVKPGITSAASLKYRQEEHLLSGADWEKNYTERILPEKIAIDLDYLERQSISGDLGIIVRTLWALFK